MGHHYFENRLVRTASELFILMILASKREAHPYEIQQVLLKEIFKVRRSQFEEFQNLIQWMAKTFEILDQEPPGDTNLLGQEMETFFPPLLKHLGPQFLVALSEDPQLQAELRQLVNTAEQAMQQEGEHLKIWDSDTAIYQVMKELENEGLIEVTRSEIHRGRGRKVFTLTENGRKTAFSTILVFGDLYQAILPYSTLFHTEEGLLFSKHQFDILHLLERVLHGNDLGKLITSINVDSPFNHLLTNLFPFLLNDALFFPALFGNYLPVEKIEERLPNEFDRAAYQHLLLHRLKDSQQRIEEIIQRLENDGEN